MPQEYAIHGIYGVGVHVANPENMVEFASDYLLRREGLVEEGDRVALQVGQPSHGGPVELVVNRTDEPGTWRYGAGTIHHFAWNADTLENQDELKFEIEGVGYTDISELQGPQVLQVGLRPVRRAARCSSSPSPTPRAAGPATSRRRSWEALPAARAVRVPPRRDLRQLEPIQVAARD